MIWLVQIKKKKSSPWWTFPAANWDEDEAYRQARLMYRGGVYDTQVISVEPVVVYNSRVAEEVVDELLDADRG